MDIVKHETALKLLEHGWSRRCGQQWYYYNDSYHCGGHVNSHPGLFSEYICEAPTLSDILQDLPLGTTIHHNIDGTYEAWVENTENVYYADTPEECAAMLWLSLHENTPKQQ